MTLLIIMTLCFASAGLFGLLLFPPATDKFISFQRNRSEVLADKMDQVFIRVKINRLVYVHIFAPPLLALAGYIFFPAELRLIGVILGLVLGFVGPGIYVKFLIEKRRNKFGDQLLDALLIMSSSLKGGLSIIQTIEVVVEEMPDPIRQEFNILLGENKMGISLEEAFNRLYERMPSIALHQVITAVLLARETGGNLPAIFSRIVTTIRSNKKIKQNLDNLTLQGRIQGIIMALLPVAFAVMVLSTNKQFFSVMLQNDIGKALLVYSVFSEIVGAFMIWKISSFKEF